MLVNHPKNKSGLRTFVPFFPSKLPPLVLELHPQLYNTALWPIKVGDEPPPNRNRLYRLYLPVWSPLRKLQTAVQTKACSRFFVLSPLLRHLEDLLRRGSPYPTDIAKETTPWSVQLHPRLGDLHGPHYRSNAWYAVHWSILYSRSMQNFLFLHPNNSLLSKPLCHTHELQPILAELCSMVHRSNLVEIHQKHRQRVAWFHPLFHEVGAWLSVCNSWYHAPARILHPNHIPAKANHTKEQQLQRYLEEIGPSNVPTYHHCSRQWHTRESGRYKEPKQWLEWWSTQKVVHHSSQTSCNFHIFLAPSNWHSNLLWLHHWHKSDHLQLCLHSSQCPSHLLLGQHHLSLEDRPR